MKRFLPLVVLALFAAPGLFAQNPNYSYTTPGDHAEVGVFGNFFRLNDQNINFGGLGARVGFNATAYVQIEAESSYDFRRAFLESASNGEGGITIADSNLRVLHFLAGPKVQTNRGPVRLFLTAKGGFDNFMFDPRPATFGTFASSVDNLRANNVIGVFYPGVGAEAFWGPIGLRFDAGDEIYFNNGTHNNLRMSFGPTIRF
jgi:hypothetical protein